MRSKGFLIKYFVFGNSDYVAWTRLCPGRGALYTVYEGKLKL